MRAGRRKVAPSVRIVASESVCAGILAREDVKAAVEARLPFAVYLATHDELDLSSLVERLWDAGCTVLAPAWNDGAYELRRYSPDTELVAGPMGVLEPARGDVGFLTLPHPEPAVWIVPGLAFTRNGARLGYGGGWYDRFLSAAAGAISLGVAYPFQMFDELPVEEHDIALADVVVAGGET